jgi:hypothetical protein
MNKTPLRSAIFILSAFFLLSLTVATVFGAEKEGLRVEIIPKVLSDRSALANSAVFKTPVDQDMSLKATFKNISMKDAPEGSIDYIVLVQRWSAETARYSSYTGTQKLVPLRFGDPVEVDIGQYHLGGHLHGLSDRHKDRLAGWKIVVTQGSKKIEFSTPPNFDQLSKEARPAH